MKQKERVYPVVTAGVALILSLSPCQAEVPDDATLVFEGSELRLEADASPESNQGSIVWSDGRTGTRQADLVTYGSIQIEFPSKDEDGNGVPDFTQFERAASGEFDVTVT